MTSLDLTRLGRTPQCLGRYVEDARGVRKIEPGFNTIHGGLEDRDTMVRTQRGDTFASPTIAVAGFESVAIEKASDPSSAINANSRMAVMMSAEVLLR